MEENRFCLSVCSCVRHSVRRSRFHGLCRLPHLHLPQEGDPGWFQRPEQRTLWVLLHPGLDLCPSAPAQWSPLRPPAQKAVRQKPGRLTAPPPHPGHQIQIKPELHFIFSLLAPEPQVSDRRPGSRRLQSLLCFCCVLNSVVVLITYLSNINRNVLTSSKTQHLTVF